MILKINLAFIASLWDRGELGVFPLPRLTRLAAPAGRGKVETKLILSLRDGMIGSFGPYGTVFEKRMTR